MKIKHMVVLAIVGFVIVIAIDLIIAMTTGFIGHAGFFEIAWFIGCVYYIEGKIYEKNN